MATVIVYPADLSAPSTVPLSRAILRLGASPDNDVHLPGGGARAHHAHILYEKGSFTLATTDDDARVTINSKRKKSSKLEDGDLIQIGDHLLRFVLYDQGLVAPPADKSYDGDSAYFRAFQRFSNRLMETYEVPALLETMLDELIDLTGADKAFLLLTDGDGADVRVARNIDRERLAGADGSVSDTIVKRVLEGGEPLIVADALSHHDFKTSHSVVNLKLCSVMCVPLKARGKILGLFYLGNDNVVNHFSDDLLEIVDLYASTAGLILANALAREELEAEVAALEKGLEDRRFGEIIGASDQMRDVF